MLSVIVLNVIMLRVIMLIVIILNAVMLNVIMLRVIMLIVIILNVVAPLIGLNSKDRPCGQCYKTVYGRNYVAIGVTQSKL
jgi:hypothetical protein